MKKRSILFLLLAILCAGCGTNNEAQQNPQSPDESQSAEAVITYSNMAGEQSRQEVQDILLSHLPSVSVDRFAEFVEEYNTAIENTGLQDEFVTAQQPVYPVEQTDILWAEKMGDYIGTNCRINTFTLLKDTIGIEPDAQADRELLFLDHEAIESRSLFSAEEKQRFDTLFARVATEPTKDVRIHAQKMKEHFEKIEFDNQARMLSVVMHDNLDGDHLFVGHVGVLLPSGNGYLFVEKLSFQEPYQAIRFDTPQAAYDYLLNKYATDYGQETAAAFIMDNAELAKQASEQ